MALVDGIIGVVIGAGATWFFAWIYYAESPLHAAQLLERALLNWEQVESVNEKAKEIETQRTQEVLDRIKK